MTSPPLLDQITAPPIVVTNPEVVKYLICQLFTEAILVLTLALLVPSILWEEWRHYSANRAHRAKVKEMAKMTAGEEGGAAFDKGGNGSISGGGAGDGSGAGKGRKGAAHSSERITIEKQSGPTPSSR